LDFPVKMKDQRGKASLLKSWCSMLEVSFHRKVVLFISYMSMSCHLLLRWRRTRRQCRYLDVQPSLMKDSAYCIDRRKKTNVKTSESTVMTASETFQTWLVTQHS
jgi:hypothetical protein